MTPEEQRIAIAEICGWKLNPGAGIHRWRRSTKWGSEWCQNLPNYSTDLNAMFQAQEILKNDGERDRYMMELGKIMGASERWGTFATAAQRAEAFLKAVGKWKD